jgi:hypothetical protein
MSIISLNSSNKREVKLYGRLTTTTTKTAGIKTKQKQANKKS